MGILNYSDDEVKTWMKDKTPEQIAQQASTMGLNADQIKQATDIGGRNYTAADINGTAASLGYNFNGANGALTKQPAAQPAPTAQTNPGGMDIAGTYYTADQIKNQFAQPGFDPNRWAQEHGITNQDQIHQMTTQAKQIAGASNPTGDAALQSAWQNYRKYNPNGAGANDYASFVQNLNPAHANAIRNGTFSGAFTDMRDFAPGGIYAGKDISYAQNGLGARGMGDGWGDGGILGGGSTGGQGSAGGAASGGAPGAAGGGTGGSSSTTASGSTGAGTWNVTPDQTVESRIAGILSGGSGLLEKARAGAQQGMIARGLQNSSMAQTAGDSAMYDAALQIAKPDAATYADAAKTNANAQTSWSIAQNNNQTSRDNTTANINAQKELQQSTQLYNNLANQTASATSIQNWGLNTITTIQTSDLSAEAKNAAIKSVQQYLADSYQIQGDWHTSAAAAITAIFG